MLDVSPLLKAYGLPRDFKLNGVAQAPGGRPVGGASGQGFFKLCGYCFASAGTCPQCGSDAAERDRAFAVIREVHAAMQRVHAFAANQAVYTARHNAPPAPVTAEAAIRSRVSAVELSDEDLKDEVTKYREYGVPEDQIAKTVIRHCTGKTPTDLPPIVDADP
jgi:hypothetical protein